MLDRLLRKTFAKIFPQPVSPGSTTPNPWAHRPASSLGPGGRSRQRNEHATVFIGPLPVRHAEEGMPDEIDLFGPNPS